LQCKTAIGRVSPHWHYFVTTRKLTLSWSCLLSKLNIAIFRATQHSLQLQSGAT